MSTGEPDQDAERRRLAATFERVADRYHGARPDYPEELFDDLVAASGLRPGDRVLEVGGGTGKATLALADRRLAVTVLEPGPALAATLRTNVAGRPVEVLTSRFEEWRPGPEADALYDLVVAATSWHWVDPALRYPAAAAALRPSGHLAFWSATHVVPDDGDPLFAELQPVYEEIGCGRIEALPRPGAVPDERAEIEASGLFDVVSVTQYDWEVRYDAEGYIDLLETFSSHIAMTPWQRDRLYGEIRRRLADRADGMLRRHWGAAVHLARRRSGPPEPRTAGAL